MKVPINSRISAKTRDMLEAIASERRKETGKAMPLSDIIREALDEYCEKRNPRAPIS